VLYFSSNLVFSTYLFIFLKMVWANTTWGIWRSLPTLKALAMHNVLVFWKKLTYLQEELFVHFSQKKIGNFYQSFYFEVFFQKLFFRRLSFIDSYIVYIDYRCTLFTIILRLICKYNQSYYVLIFILESYWIFATNTSFLKFVYLCNLYYLI